MNKLMIIMWSYLKSFIVGSSIISTFLPFLTFSKPILPLSFSVGLPILLGAATMVMQMYILNPWVVGTLVGFAVSFASKFFFAITPYIYSPILYALVFKFVIQKLLFFMNV